MSNESKDTNIKYLSLLIHRYRMSRDKQFLSGNPEERGRLQVVLDKNYSDIVNFAKDKM